MGERLFVAACIACLAVGLFIAAIDGDPKLALAGCLIGVITGLVPGLHLNMFLPFLGGATALIVGIAVSDSFFGFLPAIFLGAPEEATALSVLPGHRAMLHGHGLEAFRISVLGGFAAGLIGLMTVPFAGFFLAARPLAPLALCAVLVLLLADNRARLATALVLIASAAIGHVALPIDAIGSMLAGFFGASSILHSFAGRRRIPKQKPCADVSITPREALLGAVSGLIAGLLPAISSSVAAMLVCPRMRGKRFIAVLGGTNTVYAFMSILALEIIGRPRSAAAIAIAGEHPSFLLLFGTALAALGFSAWLAWSLSPRLVKVFDRFDHRVLSMGALVLLVALALFESPAAFAIFLASTAVGWFCIALGVRRTACMASIIIPVLLGYVL